MIIKDKITIRQFALLTFLVMVGDMMLIYPSLVTVLGKQDAWICSLLGHPIGILIIWIMYKLHQTSPELSLIEICQKLLGRWAGSVLWAAYLFYFAIGTAICTREVGDFLTTQIYLQTPIRIIIIILIITLTWGLFHGLQTMAGSIELLLPVVVVFILLLFMGLMPEVDSSNLQPYLGTPWLHLIEGTLRASFTSFGELIVLTMILPYVLSGAHLQTRFAACNACRRFAIELITADLPFGGWPLSHPHNIYISYALSQKINIGNFFQRIEAFMATAWLISTYFKSCCTRSPLSSEQLSCLS